MTTPRLSAPVLAAFAQIEDLTCTASDAAMDNLGLRGDVPASSRLMLQANADHNTKYEILVFDWFFTFGLRHRKAPNSSK